MNKSENINELAAALAKAQSAIKGAVKDANNPFFKTKYADLASVWEACRVPLTDYGLSVAQSTRMEGEIVVIETMLLHASGQFICGELALPPVKNDPQGHGSAITYARRYALAAMVGVAPEDDDGEGAVDRKAPVASKQQPVTRPANTNAAKASDMAMAFAEAHATRYAQCETEADLAALDTDKQYAASVARVANYPAAKEYLDDARNAWLTGIRSAESDKIKTAIDDDKIPY